MILSCMIPIPDAKTWQKLPGICYNWIDYYRKHSYSDFIRILAFSFIGTSTLVLQTTIRLMFSLDLESIDKGWQKRDTFFGAHYVPHNNGLFLVPEEQLCVTPWAAYDVKKEKRYPEREWFSFPPPSCGDDICLSGPSCVTLLDGPNNGNYNFCTLQSAESKTTRYPHLVINLYSFDLTKYKEDKEENGAEVSTSTRVGQSFMFLPDSKRCSVFFPVSFGATKVPCLQSSPFLCLGRSILWRLSSGILSDTDRLENTESM